jgi:predicted HTH domain antitoxin
VAAGGIAGCLTKRVGLGSIILIARRNNMSAQVNVAFPESLVDSLKMRIDEFQQQIRVLSLVKLYELGKISSGMAASIIGITRNEFLDLLGVYHVSYLADENDLEVDFANA